MNHPSTNQEGLRATLDARLQELLDRAARIDDHERERDREVPTDWPDRAQYRENDEVVARLDDLTRAEIIQIRAALVRLDEGTYGTCSDCGASIEAARLEAVATTPWCVDCAGKHEAAPGTFPTDDPRPHQPGALAREGSRRVGGTTVAPGGDGNEDEETHA